MNAQRFRLVFNRSRGILMAVAECVSARCKSAGSRSSPLPRPAMARLAPLAFAVFSALGGSWVTMSIAHAQVVAYRNAPASQQPSITNVGNGVPLINIRTPSAAGVSRNTYEQFDVQAQGAILNNSRVNTQTQLGGWVQGNPWLAAGTARVILNEIISANPSQLLGFIEVAGSTAQVVIANPAGLTCNGCGFINASRATLTTGTPILNGGNLDGYRVEGGVVRIEGGGMDASRAGYTDIIARAVQINAGLWAQTLAVTTGSNTVDANNTQVTPIAGSGAAPDFAIDVAQLGGMYAGKITLRGTEAGVGVRNAGYLGASVGNVVVTANGRLENTGGIVAATDLSIDVGAGITHRGGFQVGGNLLLTAGDDIDLAGSENFVAGTFGAQTANSIIHSDAWSRVGRLDITADTLDNRRGKFIQTGTGVGEFKLADKFDNRAGLVVSAGDVQVADTSAGHALAIENGLGSVVAEQRLAINAGSFSGGSLLSHRDLTVEIGGDFTNDTEITANRNADITVGGRFTNSALLQAGNTLSLQSGQLTNEATGKIFAANLDLLVGGTGALLNRGIIDGGNSRIQAHALNNLGSGRIYGDNLAISAGALSNAAENGSSSVIAARNRLDIAVTTLDNRDGSLIFSAGDMHIGGALDADGHAAGRASAVTNASATIESLADLTLEAERLDNLDTHFRTGINEEVTGSGQDFQNYGSAYRYTSDQVSTYLGQPNSSQWVLYLNTPTETSSSWYRYDYTRSTTETVVLERQAASIQAGGVLKIDAKDVVNDKSRLLAGGNLNLIADTLDNRDATGRREATESGTVTHYWRNKRSSGLPAQGVATSPYTAAPVVEEFSLATAIYEGNQSFSGSGFNQAGNTPGSAATVNEAPRVPNNSLFRPAPEAAGYLTETDPRFANYRQWLNSDYMLQQLALDPATTQKRLGDGFYEQRLITEQIANLTGRRFLDGYANEEDQYRALMNAGIAVAKEWNLIPGVALSAEQIARLSSDIVWLVEREVTLADGRVAKALVPQVYASVREGDLAPSGALIAGRNIDLAVAGQLVNSGAIASRGNVAVAAGDFLNRGGLLAGRELAIEAERDLSFQAGLITAKDRLALTAGGNIVVASDSYRSEAASGTREGIARQATLYASGPGASLDLSAVGNLKLDAAQVIAGQAKIVAGGDVSLSALADRSSQTLTNSRGSRTQTEMRETGTRIDTTGDLTLASGGDLSFNAARLAAGGLLAARAEGDLDVNAGRQSVEIDGRIGRSTIGIGQESVVGSTLSGKQVALSAGGDLGVVASSLVATGEMTLNATGDVRLATATESTRNDWRKGDGRNYRLESSTSEQGALLKAGGDITLVAGSDLVARAAEVGSDAGAVRARAGNDMVIEAGEASYQLEQARYKKKSGALSSTTKTTRDSIDSTTAIASTFSGETVSLVAEGDIGIKGSNVVATKDAVLAAGNDLNIEAATETHNETHFKKVKKSGAFASGASLTIGKQQMSTDQNTESTRAAKSSVGSLEGDVTLLAGNRYRQVGSDVIVPKGDIEIAAKTVDIVEARETDASRFVQKSKQSGLTVSISNPVISAVQTVQQMKEAAGNTSDGRMKALAAASAALSGYNAYSAVAAGQGKTVKLTNGTVKDKQIVTETNAKGEAVDSRDATALDKIGGVNVSISLGSSKSKSTSTQKRDSAAGSELLAGGDIRVTAGGAGAASDITLRGAQVTAGKNVTLTAEDEIKLLAAANTAEMRSSNKSSSASVGVSVGTSSGFAITAAASRGKGKANGDDLSWSNTRVEAGDTLTLNSGGDTALKGAVAAADRVVARVGGDLAIESLQDVSTYDSKQSSSGFSISIPVTGFSLTGIGGSISASKSKIESDFRSVAEQSGIRAGDGGFDVQVGQDTTLTGGAITSTQKAIDAEKNRFTTGGQLSLSNLENKAEYDAKGGSLNIGAGLSLDGKLAPQGTSAGFGEDSGNASSTTLAAISDIAGNQAARTGDAETGLKPIFDAAKVQKEIDAQVRITQMFGQLASKAVGDYADSKLKEAEKLRAQGREQEAKEIENQWGANGSLRLAAHTAIGGLTGGASGAAGAAVGTLTAPAVTDALAKAGVDGPLATALTAIASTAAGAAVGGTVGAGTALNEVANNYLSHAEADALGRAKAKRQQCKDKACVDGADAEIKYWEEEDRRRNAALAISCIDLASAACQAAIAQVNQAAASYAGKPDGWDAFGVVARERAQANTLANQYRIATSDMAAVTRLAGNIAFDLTPLLGDAKAIAEASTKFEYALAMVGALGPVGDAVKVLVKEAQVLFEAGDTIKAAEKLADANRGLINESNRLIKQYADDIEKQTGYRLGGTQRAALAKEMQTGNHAVTLTPAENAVLRNEFNRQRLNLIAEWELHTGQEWPQVQVVIKGELRYQKAPAHHVIPVQNNGPSAWWNITPAPQPGHTAIHSPGSPLDQLQSGAK